MVATINADTTNGVIITSDTSGEIELQANGVTKAKVTANGLQDANGNSITGGMYRNLVINGDMNVSQRATQVTGVTTSGYRTVDRHQLRFSSCGTWTIDTDTDVPTGQGFAKSLKYTCTTADASPASTDYAIYTYVFEGQHLQHIKKGTSNAESLTLSFWVKSNVTGTYMVELIDNDNGRQVSKGFSVSASGTWEKKTLTFPPDTTGALDNDNNGSFEINIWFAVGSSRSSGTASGSWATAVDANRAAGQTANLASATSNYLNITGIQLEVGSGASDFEFLPYDVQLARCQRYYMKSINIGTTSYASAGGYGRAAYLFPVYMRTTPTMTFVDAGGGGSKIGDGINIDGFYVTYGSLTSSQAGAFNWTATAEL